jgi:3-oxoacyl-[acyl-carrier protein] reductase
VGGSARTHRENAVDELDADRPAVRDRIARIAVRISQERADRAAVRHEHHRVTVVRRRDPLDRRDDAVGQLLARLAVVPDLAGQPPGKAFGIQLLHLGARQPGPGADVDLAQPRVLDDGEPEALADDPSRLAGTDEVARVDGPHTVTGQLLGERFGLLPAQLVQWRVGVPLPPPDAVPVGLAVPCKEKACRGHTTRLARVDLGLSGKVAVVTGSSRGIGKGIATRLVDEGADVVFCARGAEALQESVATATGPGRAHGVVADVTTPAGSTAVVDAAVTTFGGLDIVVNNVGGSGARTIDEMDAADLESVLGRNLFPALEVSRAALPALRARGGGVVALVASIWGREGGGSPGYNVAKAAEISLAKAMARDLAKDRIRVFSVAPGSTLFPGGSWERRQREDPEGIAAFIDRELPWGRFGTVDEVADVVTFLVSDRASWVVGTCVAVDGGQSRAF